MRDSITAAQSVLQCLGLECFRRHCSDGPRIQRLCTVRHLDCRGNLFVTRLKENAAFEVVEECAVPQNRNILSDQFIRFTGSQAQKGLSLLAATRGGLG